MKTTFLNLILLFSIFSSQFSIAQITFQKTFGGTSVDWGNSVQQTTDGGYIIAGVTYSFGVGGSNDVYLIKTNAYGDTLWTKTFGGTNTDWGNSVQQTSDGGYIIVGFTASFSTGNAAQVYLIKTNANGNDLWTKTLGDTYSGGASVQQTSDGGYIIVGGNQSGIISIGGEVYLIKTDTNGNIIWSKTFGNTGEDGGLSVKQTADGGYIIVGAKDGNGDLYLIKTDVNGNSLWNKIYGGIFASEGRSVQQTTDGGYIVTGYFSNFGGSIDVYLVKTDANGDTLWTRTFGGTNNDYGNSVQQTNDGGYIIVGVTESFGGSVNQGDVYLIKTNVNGDALWTKTFGGPNGEWGYSVQQTNDGGYIITGQTNLGAGGGDIYLIKTDANGNSGCNQGNPATITDIPVTQVTSPVTLVSSGGTVTSPATVVGSGGIVTTLCTTVGINEIEEKGTISIYPNPFHSSTVLKLNSDVSKNNSHLLIFSLQGTLITDIPIREKETTISRNGIESGLYLYKLISEKEIMGSGKLVIY